MAGVTVMLALMCRQPFPAGPAGTTPMQPAVPLHGTYGTDQEANFPHSHGRRRSTLRRDRQKSLVCPSTVAETAQQARRQVQSPTSFSIASRSTLPDLNLADALKVVVGGPAAVKRLTAKKELTARASRIVTGCWCIDPMVAQASVCAGRTQNCPVRNLFDKELRPFCIDNPLKSRVGHLQAVHRAGGRCW